jgi:hypothetical protein
MDKTDNKTETKGDKSNRNKEGLPFPQLNQIKRN